MAFRIDIENEEGHVTGFWEITQVNHMLEQATRIVTIYGYKNKAAKLAGKRPLVVTVTLLDTPPNMNIGAVEAAVMSSAKFTGAVAD